MGGIDYSPVMQDLQLRINRLQATLNVLIDIQGLCGQASDAEIKQYQAIPQAVVDEPKKLQRTKTKSKKLGAPGESRRRIIDYLKINPNTGVRSIAEILQLPVTTVDWHMRDSYRRGLVNKSGLGKNTVWHLVEPPIFPSPAAPPQGMTPPKKSEKTEDKKHICEQCGAKFIVYGSLLSHIRLSHGGNYDPA
jgi:hypothetical protein